MIRCTRRDVLAGIGAVSVAGAGAARTGNAMPLRAAAAQEPSRTLAFATGDVVVGCTQLNDPADDHAGRGRILHYDGDLKLRNTLWVDDTTHIVQGLRFAPDRTLWAFDAFAYRIVRFGADGRPLPHFTGAPARSFGHVTFARDGSFYLGENFSGESSRMRLKTTIPFVPGTKRFGEGHLFSFSREGKLRREYATAVHGGMGGFQALTSSALTRDERTIVYTSESGPRIMRYDVANDRQLPDLLAFPDNSGKWFFDVAFDLDDRLLVVRGTSVDALDAQGKVLRSYPLAQFGWASLSVPVTRTHVYATNWFSGDIAKLDLRTGAVLATANVGARKCLAGVAEFA